MKGVTLAVTWKANRERKATADREATEAKAKCFIDALTKKIEDGATEISVLVVHSDNIGSMDMAKVTNAEGLVNKIKAENRRVLSTDFVGFMKLVVEFCESQELITEFRKNPDFGFSLYVIAY